MQQPIQDRIVVRPDQGEDSFGSIIIPESAIEDVNRGIVVMVGPGRDGEPCGVEVGDYVIYSAFAGTHITIDDDELLVMRWYDCLMREWKADGYLTDDEISEQESNNALEGDMGHGDL